MRRMLPVLSISSEISAVKSVPYVRMPATGLVAPAGRYAAACVGLAGLTGGVFEGFTHSLTILTVLAPMDVASSGNVKLVSRLAVVDHPSSEFTAACMAAPRHGTVGRLIVPSDGTPGVGEKYKSIGYGRLPVVGLNFAVATS